MKKEFIVVVFIMLMIWASLFIFFWFKADEITKDPCSICAERMGEDVICSVSVGGFDSIAYKPNGSVEKLFG